jgi:protein ATS1
MTCELFVFGSNGEGQLGIPPADIVTTPTRVPDSPPLGDLKTIRGGDNHTLFLTGHGTAYGVGDNRKGQLVPGSKETRIDRIQELRNSVYLCAATCESSAYIATASQLQVHTEGTGQWGELGRGDEVTSTLNHPPEHLPSVEPLPGKIVSLSAGVWHYAAVLEDGSIYGWGKARLGQLGDKLSGKVTVPTRVEDIAFKPTKVVCGKDFTYLIGTPSSGEHTLLGRDKFNIISGMPSDIKGWKDVGATWHAIFVLFGDGRLIAWGKSNMWDLLPPELPPIEKIAVGSDHVLAVTKQGKLISWGWGKHGNCGNLPKVQRQVKNDMVSGFWNEIEIPGRIHTIGAGFCTSFVVVQNDEKV